jgi:hypothetical protein
MGETCREIPESLEAKRNVWAVRVRSWPREDESAGVP